MGRPLPRPGLRERANRQDLGPDRDPWRGCRGCCDCQSAARRLDGAQITVIDGRAQHWYQPGFTLIAAGLQGADYSVSQTTDWLPRGINFIADYAAEIDPEANRITTLGGERVDYDYLIVATGLTLDWDAVEGSIWT